jgi:DNA-binding beta-propeller fold protein YncE
MVKTGRATGVLVAAIAIVIGACGGGSDAQVGSSPAALAAASDTAVSQLPTATPTPTYSGEPVEEVLIEWKTGGGDLVPLDAALATAGPPEPLVQNANAFAAPNGTMVAVADAVGLTLYRVDRWERLWRVDGLGGSARVMWAPDSRSLYVVKSGRLSEVPVGTGAQRDAGVLASPLWDAAISRDGTAVVALSYDGDENLIDVRKTHLAAIDTTTGKVRSRVELDSVVVGQQAEQGPTEKYQAMYWPALALSPDGHRAYIAHSDSEAVTVVDLDRMVVERTVALQAPRSRWERSTSAVGDLFVSRAEAKGGLYFRRETTVSPDGRWLYVTGTAPKPCGFFACEADAPAGLWVLDTRTMRVVHREEGINHIALSSDDAYIAGTGTSYSQEKGAIGRGVKVLRAGTWERVLHFEPQADLQSPAFTPDGAGLLVVSPSDGLEYARVHGGTCPTACHRLLRINLPDGRVTAMRAISWSFVVVGTH